MLVEWHPKRLWYCDTTIRRHGVDCLHRMIVVKRADGTLIIINPVELTTQLQLVLSDLGLIKQICITSPTYHPTLSEWWLAYSEAQFLATPTVIQQRSDLHFDDALSSQTHKSLQGELLQTSLLGSKLPRKVIFCDPQSRTLILPDLLLANQPHLPLPQRLVTVILGAGKSIVFPFSDRTQFERMSLLRASIQEVLTWPIEHIISSNGLTVGKDGKNAFYQAFRWAFVSD
ncbi:hypothetical protein INR79_26370 [Vibrio sp. SCSIO 43132]|nr:hypothetical protein INR79_26370 [Vibrio sp. SCSIO 43132]